MPKIYIIKCQITRHNYDFLFSLIYFIQQTDNNIFHTNEYRFYHFL